MMPHLRPSPPHPHQAPRRARPPRPWWARPAGPAAALCALVLLLAGCTVHPTPYVPRGEDGYGYEAVRLQERVWRIAFRANPYTAETRVLDYLYLRAAELTLDSGYSHFVVRQEYGRTELGYRPVDPMLGGGFGRFDRPYWGGGFGYPAYYEAYPDYHVAMFIIRMLDEQEAQGREQAYNAQFIVDHLGPQVPRSFE